MKTKRLFKIHYFLSLILLISAFCHEAWTQSVRRQCISSLGSISHNDFLTTHQTAGQCYHTTNHFDEHFSLCQGFQQSAPVYIQHFGSPDLSRNDIRVFPNPASYSITLSSEKEVGPTLIQILNLTGNIFYSERINGLKSHVIPCDQWPQGIYLIKILDAQQNFQTFKLMIAKQ
jgi:hypothetical protein